MKADRPDFLVVVMDCVRALDFPVDGLGPGTVMPEVAALRKESVVYSRAVSPASWTFPSHASLFTGLYPWESGAHAKASLRLPSGLPTIPQALRSCGYESVSLSGNPVLDRSFGLIDSFDTAFWADWWEPFLRTERDPSHVRRPGFNIGSGPEGKLPRDGSVSGGLRRSLLGLSPYLNRFPYLMDLATRVGQGIIEPSRERSLETARWIEPSLARWLGERRRDTPVFAFVNLIDAHEPYYTDSATVGGALDWLRYTRVRQDHFGRALEKWSPAPREMALLRGLYRNMIRRMDRRIGALRRVFDEAGRGENLCMVLTSDHGQAFDEHGVLFHTLRIDEPEVRIPLWVRYPRAESGGSEARGWASLIDVAPTALALAGSGASISRSGVSLDSLIDAPRAAAVLTLGDGFTWPHLTGSIDTQLRQRLDRPYVAGYEGSFKVLRDVLSGREIAFDIDRDPEERDDVLKQNEAVLGSTLSRVRDASGQLGSATPIPPDAEIEARLRSWGYL